MTLLEFKILITKLILFRWRYPWIILRLFLLWLPYSICIGDVWLFLFITFWLIPHVFLLVYYIEVWLHAHFQVGSVYYWVYGWYERHIFHLNNRDRWFLRKFRTYLRPRGFFYHVKCVIFNFGSYVLSLANLLLLLIPIVTCFNFSDNLYNLVSDELLLAYLLIINLRIKYKDTVDFIWVSKIEFNVAISRFIQGIFDTQVKIVSKKRINRWKIKKLDVDIFDWPFIAIEVFEAFYEHENHFKPKLDPKKWQLTYWAYMTLKDSEYFYGHRKCFKRKRRSVFDLSHVSPQELASLYIYRCFFRPKSDNKEWPLFYQSYIASKSFESLYERKYEFKSRLDHERWRFFDPPYTPSKDLESFYDYRLQLRPKLDREWWPYNDLKSIELIFEFQLKWKIQQVRNWRDNWRELTHVHKAPVKPDLRIKTYKNSRYNRHYSAQVLFRKRMNRWPTQLFFRNLIKILGVIKLISKRLVKWLICITTWFVIKYFKKLLVYIFNLITNLIKFLIQVLNERNSSSFKST